MRFIMILIMIGLAGCAGNKNPPNKSIEKANPSRTKQQVSLVEAPERKRDALTGGLYQASYGHFLFSDRRAYRLGDILTVELAGKTSISMGGNSNVVKKNNVNIPDPTILGRTSASILPAGNTFAFNFQPSREYGGTTSSGRENSLQGNVAVKVVEVLTNGTLRIQGSKWLTINNGREHIQITGLVRPEDVSTDNKVKSERLAEIKLDYVATGNNGNAHKPGWMTRVLNSPWFPF